MIEIPESLKTVFTADLEERTGEHIIRVPSDQIDHGAVTPGETYRVVLTEVSGGGNDVATDGSSAAGRTGRSAERGPPVEEDEVLEVEIETIGDQGDGIAKVDRGFVVIVPNGEPGDKVTVRIDSVHENMAFAEIIERDTDVTV